MNGLLILEPGQDLPTLKWLRAFEAAACHLSFTRAAAEVNLTQSAISQHVRSLEAFIGRDLFIRKTRAATDGSRRELCADRA